MIAENGPLSGIVRGKTIELDRETGLPEGQAVAVVLRPTSANGEGLARAFGGWADGAEGLDEFLKELRKERQQARGGADE